MAAGDKVEWEWGDPEGASSPTVSYSCFCEWRCCDNPEHETQSGFIVLTPRDGVTAGGIINKLEQANDEFKVRYLIPLPCYLSPEEVAEYELRRLEQEG